MLELRPNCENCGKDLPYNTTQAMICSFECTFCVNCVEQILQNVCPNCGGDFQNRPIRPKEYLTKYPTKKEKTLKPVNEEIFKVMLNHYKKYKPSDR